MAKLEKKVDEFWTSYLARRLEQEGFNVPVFISYISHQPLQFADLKFSKDHPPLTIGLEFKEYDLMPAVNYTELAETSIEPYVRIDKDDSSFEIKFNNQSNTCTVENERDSKNFKHFFDDEKYKGLAKYRNGGEYPAEEVIKDLIEFVKTEAAKAPIKETEEETGQEYTIEEDEEEHSEPVTVPRSIPQAEPYTEQVSDPRIDQILRSVKNLERIASEHPLVMKSDGEYLRELYTREINEDINNLKSFEFKGQRIPYVLTTSHDLRESPGRACLNLYLVAKDKAPEEWQQQIIAYHESMCVRLGHDLARSKEIELAKHLGKEKEYAKWIAKIDKKRK